MKGLLAIMALALLASCGGESEASLSEISCLGLQADTAATHGLRFHRSHFHFRDAATGEHKTVYGGACVIQSISGWR